MLRREKKGNHVSFDKIKNSFKGYSEPNKSISLIQFGTDMMRSGSNTKTVRLHCLVLRYKSNRPSLMYTTLLMQHSPCSVYHLLLPFHSQANINPQTLVKRCSVSTSKGNSQHSPVSGKQFERFSYSNEENINPTLSL